MTQGNDDHTHHPSPADVLELDAHVFSEHTASITAWLPVHSEPDRILDLGSGTGAGTFALLAQFTRARRCRRCFDPAPADAAHNALSRMRHGVANLLDPADRIALDRLFDPEDSESLWCRTDIAMRTDCVAWAARAKPIAARDMTIILPIRQSSMPIQQSAITLGRAPLSGAPHTHSAAQISSRYQ